MSKVGNVSIIIKVSKDSILSSKELAELRELVSRVSRSYVKNKGDTSKMDSRQVPSYEPPL